MPRRPPIAALLAVAALTVFGACRDGGPDGDPPTTTSTSDTSPSSTAAPRGDDDPELEAVLLEAADLPAGFRASDEVDETITSFCIGEDATAGLQASARAVQGFAREAGGASVIQLAFRFRGDGAATFVEQADAALTRCSDVPTDASGLAFAYEPLAAEVRGALDGISGSATGRFGVSAGAGNLTLEVAVVQIGEDIGMLVAVLGLDEPRTELDDLAIAAFGAVAERAQAVAG